MTRSRPVLYVRLDREKFYSLLILLLSFQSYTGQWDGFLYFHDTSYVCLPWQNLGLHIISLTLKTVL